MHVGDTPTPPPIIPGEPPSAKPPENKEKVADLLGGQTAPPSLARHGPFPTKLLPPPPLKKTASTYVLMPPLPKQESAPPPSTFKVSHYQPMPPPKKAATPAQRTEPILAQPSTIQANRPSSSVTSKAAEQTESKTLDKVKDGLLGFAKLLGRGAFLATSPVTVPLLYASLTSATLMQKAISRLSGQTEATPTAKEGTKFEKMKAEFYSATFSGDLKTIGYGVSGVAVAGTVADVKSVLSLFKALGKAIGSIGSKPETVVSETVTPAKLKDLSGREGIQGAFASVHSETLVAIDPKFTRGEVSREAFLHDASYRTNPPIISSSSFVPDRMVDHLMKNKKDRALGRKYEGGTDQITNMEAAMHTYVTPIGAVKMTGDYRFENTALNPQGHGAVKLGEGQARNVILSFAIHPDFEYVEPGRSVVGEIAILGDRKKEGAKLPDNFEILDAEGKKDETQLSKYDRALRDHLIYHLSSDHELPAAKDVKKMTVAQGIAALEQYLEEGGDVSQKVKGQYVQIGDRVLSLEILFNSYVHQLQNEFSVLEAASPDSGYIYTVDPPGEFIKGIGRNAAPVLNRLQILAMKHIAQNNPLPKLKAIGYGAHADPTVVETALKKAFAGTPNEHVRCLKKSELYPDRTGNHYTAPPELRDCALVLHNNSDGFGQNIEYESASSSMDGVVGNHSDAALVVKRDRPDLLQHKV